MDTRRLCRRREKRIRQEHGLKEKAESFANGKSHVYRYLLTKRTSLMGVAILLSLQFFYCEMGSNKSAVVLRSSLLRRRLTAVAMIVIDGGRYVDADDRLVPQEQIERYVRKTLLLILQERSF